MIEAICSLRLAIFCSKALICSRETVCVTFCCPLELLELALAVVFRLQDDVIVDVDYCIDVFCAAGRLDLGATRKYDVDDVVPWLVRAWRPRAPCYYLNFCIII